MPFSVIKLFGHNGSLVVNGYSVLVHTAACARSLAYVHQFRRKAVADVHHRSRHYAVFFESINNVFASLRFELALHEVFFPCKIVTAALNGGEDYELLFTVPLSDHDKVTKLEGVKSTDMNIESGRF